MRYPVLNLGQVAAPMSCPPVSTDPKLNCQGTPDGGVICSDGTYFSPGCPQKPAVTSPGVTTYTKENGQTKLQTPPPFDLGQETGTQFPWLAVAIAAGGIVIGAVV